MPPLPHTGEPSCIFQSVRLPRNDQKDKKDRKDHWHCAQSDSRPSDAEADEARGRSGQKRRQESLTDHVCEESLIVPRPRDGETLARLWGFI